MKRFIPWPRSLFGQVLASVAIALLVAQAISAVLLFQASEQRREGAMLTSAAFQLVSAGREDMRRVSRPRDRERSPAEREMRRAMRDQTGGARMRGLPRRLRIQTSDSSPVLDGEQRAGEREAALREILSGQGIEADALHVVSRRAGSDPALQNTDNRFARFRANPNWADRTLLVAGLKRSDSDIWQVVRVPEPKRDSRALPTLAAQTLIMFEVLLLLLTLILRRITRPLAALTQRVDQFGQTHDADGQIVPSGPADVQDLITAHNSMETRISALLDEKDIMLGAIGHDLKTPLAALRVRIESVEDETERRKMAESIEDITATLDDILTLARIGRSATPPERANMGALTASVVEEFEDMGKQVTLGETPRIAIPVHVTWIRRALRNLIANAVRYGGSAHVELLKQDRAVILQVTDNGPGIPDDQIGKMLEAFTRGEASRNRATGGAGLGLTLARAIAENHGGSLELTNRAEGGLCARMVLPAGPDSRP